MVSGNPLQISESEVKFIMKVHDVAATKSFKSAKNSVKAEKQTTRILPEKLYEANIISATKLVQKRSSSYRRQGDEYYMFETRSEVFFGQSIWGKQLYDFLQGEGITRNPVKAKFMRTRRKGKRYYVCLAEILDSS